MPKEWETLRKLRKKCPLIRRKTFISKLAEQKAILSEQFEKEKKKQGEIERLKKKELIAEQQFKVLNFTSSINIEAGQTVAVCFGKNWENISLAFTPELEKEWTDKGFAYQQAKEWIDIGLTVNDANFANWLASIKGGNFADPTWCLNNSNLEELKKEYTDYLVLNLDIREAINLKIKPEFAEKKETENGVVELTEPKRKSKRSGTEDSGYLTENGEQEEEKESQKNHPIKSEISKLTRVCWKKTYDEFKERVEKEINLLENINKDLKDKSQKEQEEHQKVIDLCGKKEKKLAKEKLLTEKAISDYQNQFDLRRSLQEKVDFLTSQSEISEDKIHKLLNDYRKQFKLCEKLKAEIDSLSEQLVKEKDDRIDYEQQLIKDSRKQSGLRQILKGKLKEREEKLATANDKEKYLQETIEYLNNDNNKINDELEEIKIQLENSKKNLQTEYDNHQTIQNKLIQERDISIEKNNEYLDKINAAQSILDIPDLVYLTSLLPEGESLTSLINNLNAAHANLTAANNAKDVAEAARDAMKDEWDDALNAKDTAETALVTEQASHRTTQTNLNTVWGQLTNKSALLASKENIINNLTTELGRKDTEITDLMAERNSLSSEKEDLIAELTGLEEIIEGRNQAAIRLNEQLNSLQTERDEAIRQAAAEKAQAAEFKTQLENIFGFPLPADWQTIIINWKKQAGRTSSETRQANHSPEREIVRYQTQPIYHDCPQRLNSQFKLGLSENEINLLNVIERLEKLINPPAYSIIYSEDSQQAKLQQELKNAEEVIINLKNETKQIAPSLHFGEDLVTIKTIDLEKIKNILPEHFLKKQQSLIKEIKNVANYQQLSQHRNQLIKSYLDENQHNLQVIQQAKDNLINQQKKEKIFAGVVSAAGLLTVIALIGKIKKYKSANADYRQGYQGVQRELRELREQMTLLLSQIYKDNKSQ